jgi:putative ABC transport system permease protein
MLQDLRFAVRALWKARGFSTAAILTLAAGMSATTIVYAVVDATMLRPLPFGDRSTRLVTLHSTHPTQAQDWDDSALSYPDLIDLRESSRTLEGIEGVLPRNVSLSADRETERVAAASITPGLFRLLGVSPLSGRDFRDEDGAAPGFESVVLISAGIWQRQFGGDPSVVGRTIPINGRRLSVIGIMPPGFAFPERHDVWLPFRLPQDASREGRSLTAVGLLRPGQSLNAARLELSSLAAALAARFPDTNRAWGVHAMPLRDLYIGAATRRGLTAMLVAVALVLLVSCANVASLLVARGIGRVRELTVRSALGASRQRIVRLLMIESLVLTVIAGVLAVFTVAWGLDALVASMPEPPPYWAQIRIDARVIGFAFVVSLATALLSGLVPALRASRVDLTSGSLHGARASGTPSQRRLQGALVAAQIALSLGLLVGATLLAKSTVALQHADIGFDASPLLSGRMYIAGDGYDSPTARAEILERVLSRLGSLPGVTAAAATGAIPADDGGDRIRLIPDRGVGARGEEIGAQMVPASSRLFDALGLRLIEGRTFSSDEIRRADANVVIVSQQLAARFWPGASALGRQLRVDGLAPGPRVIGVAPDIVYEELGEETDQSRLIVYVPPVQAGWRTMALLVRTAGRPASIATSLRTVVREVDSNFAAYDVMTMSDRRALTSWGERFIGRTFGAFSVVALFLACIGVYGLTAHAAAERRREVGIRLAIGARPVDIIRLFLGRGAALAVAGSAAGVPLAFASAKLVEAMLFRTSAWDVQAWTLLPVSLVASVMLASFLPAYRASRIEATEALRVL